MEFAIKHDELTFHLKTPSMKNRDEFLKMMSQKNAEAVEIDDENPDFVGVEYPAYKKSVENPVSEIEFAERVSEINSNIMKFEDKWLIKRVQFVVDRITFEGTGSEVNKTVNNDFWSDLSIEFMYELLFRFRTACRI